MSQFLSHVARLFTQKPRTRKRPARQQPPARFVPSFDELENRITPIATVKSTVVGSVLTITAKDVTTPVGSVVLSDNDNVLQIVGGATPKTFTVTASNQIPLNGFTATNGSTLVTGGNTSQLAPGDKVSGTGIPAGDTIASIAANGTDFTLAAAAGAGAGANTLTFSRGQIDTLDSESFGTGAKPITSITLNLGLGDDSVTLQNSTLTGTLTFNGGSGNNYLYIDGQNGAGANTIGNVTVNNLNGNNYVEIGNGTNTISGKLSITNGNGNNTVGLGSTSSGSGTDVLIIGNGPTGGSVSITNGAGDNTITSNGHANSLTVGTVAKPGTVTIKNGNGTDSIHLDYKVSCTITGATSITNGAGAHYTSFGNTSTNNTDKLGGLTISNGTNDDTSSNYGCDTYFGAKTTTITGNLTITNKAGFETTYLVSSAKNTGSAFTVTGQTTITNGVGGSRSTFESDNLTLGTATAGGLTLTTGAGDQSNLTLGLSGGTTDAIHNLTIKDGTGGSKFTLNHLAAGKSTISGNLSITNGGGYALIRTTGTNIAGTATLSLGAGGANVILTGTNVGTALKKTNLTITATDGNDGITIGKSTISGSTSITLGNGNDLFDTFDSAFAALKLTMGDGNDTVLISQSASAITATIFSGAVSVDLGSGDNFIQIGGSGQQATFAASPIKTTFTADFGQTELDVILADTNFVPTAANTVGILLVKKI